MHHYVCQLLLMGIGVVSVHNIIIALINHIIGQHLWLNLLSLGGVCCMGYLLLYLSSVSLAQLLLVALLLFCHWWICCLVHCQSDVLYYGCVSLPMGLQTLSLFVG